MEFTPKRCAHLSFVAAVLFVLFGAYHNTQGTSELSMDIVGHMESSVQETIGLFANALSIAIPTQSIVIITDEGVDFSEDALEEFENSIQTDLDLNFTFTYLRGHDDRENCMDEFAIKLHCQEENSIHSKAYLLPDTKPPHNVHGYVICDHEHIRANLAAIGREYREQIFQSVCTTRPNSGKHCVIEKNNLQSDVLHKDDRIDINVEFVYEGKASINSKLSQHLKFKQLETQYLAPILRPLTSLGSFRIKSRKSYISTLTTSQYPRLGYREVSWRHLVSAVKHGGGSGYSSEICSKKSYLCLVVLLTNDEETLVMTTAERQFEKNELKNLTSYQIDLNHYVTILNGFEIVGSSEDFFYQDFILLFSRHVQSLLSQTLRSKLGLKKGLPLITPMEVKLLQLHQVHRFRNRIIESVQAIETMIEKGARIWNDERKNWIHGSIELRQRLEVAGFTQDHNTALPQLVDCLSKADQVAMSLVKSLTLHSGESYFPMEHLAAVFLPMWMPLALPLIAGFIPKKR